MIEISEVAKRLIASFGGAESFTKAMNKRPTMTQEELDKWLTEFLAKCEAALHPAAVEEVKLFGPVTYHRNPVRRTTATVTIIDEPMEPQETWRDLPPLL